MVERTEVKSYSTEEMDAYCKKNIDHYKMEPIIRAAYHQGLISPGVAFVHLRIAQMEKGKDKISCSRIAQEANISPASVTQYKEKPLKGIYQEVFIQLLIKTHPTDWMDLCECDKPFVALAEYVNEHRTMKLRNGKGEGVQTGVYELEREKELTKDVCRKTYRKLVSNRVRGWDTVVADIVAVITVESVKNGETITVLICRKGENGKGIILECSKNTVIHEVAAKLRSIIGGLLSNHDCWESVYLQRTGNRKISLAMECVALGNKNVYLI